MIIASLFFASVCRYNMWTFSTVRGWTGCICYGTGECTNMWHSMNSTPAPQPLHIASNSVLCTCNSSDTRKEHGVALRWSYTHVHSYVQLYWFTHVCIHTHMYVYIVCTYVLDMLQYVRMCTCACRQEERLITKCVLTLLDVISYLLM